MAGMPAIFFGHGNPMNALLDNPYTEAWRIIGKQISTPKSIVSVSAHWFVPGSTAQRADRRHPQYRTENHSQFRWFSPRTYQVQYPAAGDPELARRLQRMLAPVPVTPAHSWGLDHGAWSVLRHAWPKADIRLCN